MRITLIPGDGIGPEVSDSAVKCIEATGVEVEWDIQPVGADHIDHGEPLPKRVIDSIKKNKLALKAPITTPVSSGYRSITVSLRQTLDLYANVRPCKIYTGVKTPFTNIDIVVIRENTEDLYAGIEFDLKKAETKRLISFVKKEKNSEIRKDSAISLKANSVFASNRISEFAFKYARKFKRKKITAVHKANILKFSDGLFLNSARRVAKKYPAIGFEEKIVDNMAMQLVQKPQNYDILLCPNLYGDILSDLCAGLVGGLGLAPGANIGSKYAVFETVHGSAPKYAGKNKVNPTAMILAGVLMLRHIGEKAADDEIDNAVASVIKEDKHVTYDLNPKNPVGTKEMTKAVIRKLK